MSRAMSDNERQRWLAGWIGKFKCWTDHVAVFGPLKCWLSVYENGEDLFIRGHMETTDRDNCREVINVVVSTKVTDLIELLQKDKKRFEVALLQRSRQTFQSLYSHELDEQLRFNGKRVHDAHEGEHK